MYNILYTIYILISPGVGSDVHCAGGRYTLREDGKENDRCRFVAVEN